MPWDTSETAFKAPGKRTHHCWPTSSNLVWCYMFRLFAHPVACCWEMLSLREGSPAYPSYPFVYFLTKRDLSNASKWKFDGILIELFGSPGPKCPEIQVKLRLKPRGNGRIIVGQHLPTLCDVTCSVCLHTLLHVVGKCCPWEKGHPPTQATLSYISLQNVANCLHEQQQKIGSPRRVTVTLLPLPTFLHT